MAVVPFSLIYLLIKFSVSIQLLYMLLLALINLFVYTAQTNSCCCCQIFKMHHFLCIRDLKSVGHELASSRITVLYQSVKDIHFVFDETVEITPLNFHLICLFKNLHELYDHNVQCILIKPICILSNACS